MKSIGTRLARNGELPSPIKHVAVEVFLRSDDYEPAAEYVDGVVEERAAGNRDHSSWQSGLLAFFISREDGWGVRALPSLLTRVAPTRYRVPDIAVIDPMRPREQIITHPPLAVFEILSAEDRASCTLRKLGDYAAMGIEQVVLIEPDTRTYYRFIEGGLVPITHVGKPEDRLHFALSEVEKLLD